MLFKLRYRTHSVQEELIEADNPVQAEDVGRAYCERLTRLGVVSRATFITTSPAVVATKAILGPTPEDVAKAPKGPVAPPKS